MSNKGYYFTYGQTLIPTELHITAYKNATFKRYIILLRDPWSVTLNNLKVIYFDLEASTIA
jgi:hypothetical protein